MYCIQEDALAHVVDVVEGGGDTDDIIGVKEPGSFEANQEDECSCAKVARDRNEADEDDDPCSSSFKKRKL